MRESPPGGSLSNPRIQDQGQSERRNAGGRHDRRQDHESESPRHAVSFIPGER